MLMEMTTVTTLGLVCCLVLTTFMGDKADGSITIGGSRPRTRSQSRPKTTTEVASTPTDIASVGTPPDGLRNNTPNRPDGPHTHFPSSLAHYPGHPPLFQDHTINFNHVPFPNHGHNQYGRGHYPFFQDPNAQAIFAQAVTQLAVLMGQPPQMGQMGGIPGNVPTINGFPGSPGGWGMFPAWPPSTPTTSRYSYGHDHQQRPFQDPYATHNQMGNGMGTPIPPSTLFPPSNAFPSPLSLPAPLTAVQEAGVVQGGRMSRAGSRSRPKGRVSFAPDPRPGSGPTGEVDDPGEGETPDRGIESSPPTVRSNRQTKGVGRGTPRPRTDRKGKSKADEGSELDMGDMSDSGEEGSASVDRGLPPKSRGRTPGPGR